MVAEADLPYGRQQIDEDDIAAVVEVLRSDWLTTGPVVDQFEEAVAAFVGSAHGVALSSGTAALHACMNAIGIGPGDEVILPPLTFVATANAIVYQGGSPVFADVCKETLLLDPERVEAKISPRTKAIIAVDFAGQPCDYDAMRELARKHDLNLVADASHSLGAAEKGRLCGSLADLTVFSFHPVKPITTAEGGMVVCNEEIDCQRMRQFRNHGLNLDHRQRAQKATWCYDLNELGYNYRLSDLQAALGLSQLRKLPAWIARRQALAAFYDREFRENPSVEIVKCRSAVSHGYHLYLVKVPRRNQVFQSLRSQGIGCNVHYLPVHLQPYYRQRFACQAGDCPVAEAAYQEVLSLPIYPAMKNEDALRVVAAVFESLCL